MSWTNLPRAAWPTHHKSARTDPPGIPRLAGAAVSVRTLAVVSAVVLASCSAPSPNSAAPASGSPVSTATPNGAGEKITVYSGQHEQTAKLLVDAFTKATGITVNLRSADEASLANQILQEGAASPADVFYSENPPALEAVRENHLLAQVDPTTLAAVPAADSSPQGQWVGVSARAAALAFNTNQTTDAALPASVLDMASPGWVDKFGYAPTETDFQPVVTAIARLKGADTATRWLAEVKAHGKPYPDNETLVAAVNTGEVATGILDHYYWYRLAREVGPAHTTSALHYFGPGDAGSLVDVSGAAVLASSKHASAAQKFLAFLVNKDGQNIIATSDSFEYPLGSGVVTAQPLRPFNQLRPPALTVEDLGDGKASLAMLQQAGML